MSKSKLRLVRFLPALIFALVPTITIMTGWSIGTNMGGANPENQIDPLTQDLVKQGLLPADTIASQAAGQGGVSGGLWGLVLGSFVSFGGFGFVIAWAWRRTYPNMQLGQSLLLVLGWMFVPAIIFLFVLVLLF